MGTTEFDIINRYFTDRTKPRGDVALGIGDDCALLQVSPNQLLATTIDTLVEGVHFLADTSPYDLGYKSLAVSLSDLAAMGALPTWVTLAITLPHADEMWLQNFSDGFFSLVNEFSLQLVGGNTTRGPLSVTTQLHGFLPLNRALRRDTARIGDAIFVSGNLGEAGLALQMLLGNAKIATSDQTHLLQRLNRPTPRVAEGLALLNIANAAIDISDGLAADLNHILERSHVGATIDVEDLNLSPFLLRHITQTAAWNLALSAGDDYELCFTVAPERVAEIQRLSANFSCGFKMIGKIEKESGLRIKHRDGSDFKLDSPGYEHCWVN